MATFTTLTMNCFGVPAPSTLRRLRTLATELRQLDADVVCLQEVQAHPYRRLLTRLCADVYPYHAHEPFVHAPTGGLLTLSRHPVTQSRFILYRERGLWYTPALADWILHKGVLLTHLQYEGVPIVVLNTHLTANYSGDWSPQNRFAKQEWEQLQQLADLVNTQPSASLVWVVGDFNIPRGSWLADQFLQRSGLIDPLAGDLRPTFRPWKGLPARYAAAIDFNLVRLLPTLPARMTPLLRFEEKRRLPDGQEIFLSDHDALELRLTW
jgi:endonuclease/exonuclease/phosphatase family metal-dependent hydrolase